MELTNVKIPKELTNKARAKLEENGYISLSDLVRDLIREWVEKNAD